MWSSCTAASWRSSSTSHRHVKHVSWSISTRWVVGISVRSKETRKGPAGRGVVNVLETPVRPELIQDGAGDFLCWADDPRDVIGAAAGGVRDWLPLRTDMGGDVCRG